MATVGIGGARNAGILAAQILAVADEGLREKLMVFKEKMAARVRERNARLQENQGKGK